MASEWFFLPEAYVEKLTTNVVGGKYIVKLWNHEMKIVLEVRLCIT